MLELLLYCSSRYILEKVKKKKSDEEEALLYMHRL